MAIAAVVLEWADKILSGERQPVRFHHLKTAASVTATPSKRGFQTVAVAVANNFSSCGMSMTMRGVIGPPVAKTAG